MKINKSIPENNTNFGNGSPAPFNQTQGNNVWGTPNPSQNQSQSNGAWGNQNGNNPWVAQSPPANTGNDDSGNGFDLWSDDEYGDPAIPNNTDNDSVNDWINSQPVGNVDTQFSVFKPMPKQDKVATMSSQSIESIDGDSPYSNQYVPPYGSEDDSVSELETIDDIYGDSVYDEEPRYQPAVQYQPPNQQQIPNQYNANPPYQSSQSSYSNQSYADEPWGNEEYQTAKQKKISKRDKRREERHFKNPGNQMDFSGVAKVFKGLLTIAILVAVVFGFFQFCNMRAIKVLDSIHSNTSTPPITYFGEDNMYGVTSDFRVQTNYVIEASGGPRSVYNVTWDSSDTCVSIDSSGYATVKPPLDEDKIVTLTETYTFMFAKATREYDIIVLKNSSIRNQE